MNKFLRILAPIVALGLIIGALVGVGASAADGDSATTPEIISMNVEYGSELYIYYAVAKDSVAGTPTFEVLADADASAVSYVVSDYTEATVHGIACYVFKTAGVAPSLLNEVQYVRAADGENKGDVVAYSVEEYLNTRLYKNGVAAATEGKALAQKNLYFQLIKYGQSAQAVFQPDAAEKIGKPGLVIVGNAAASHAYEYGDYIALVAPEVEGKTFSYWAVDETTVYGAKLGNTRYLANGFEYVLANNSAVITPVYDAEEAALVEKWDPYVLHFNSMPDSKYYTIGTGSDSEKPLVAGTNTWQIVTLEDGNKVLKIDKDCSGIKLDGSKKSYNWGVNNTIFPTYKEDDANAAIIEFKLKLSDLYGNAGIQITLYDKSVDNAKAPVRWWLTTPNHTTGAEFRYQDYYNNVATAQGDPNHYAKLGAYNGEWFTIRFEYRNTYDDAGNVTGIEYKTFVNGKHIATSDRIYGTKIVSGECAITKVTDLYKFMFNFNNDYLGDFFIDDISFKLIHE